MTVCTYDNPETMLREAWQDGKLIAHISAKQMMTKNFNGHQGIFFGLNVGRDFVSGRVVGDVNALPPNADVTGIAPTKDKNE